VIKLQIIKENSKPVAVIMDYRGYLRLKEIEEDPKDYYSAARTKATSKKWTAHEDLKKELGL
jgi:hypothetical protein